jgi:flagellum-specific peptidoglycan hydrolase FlgJ
MGKWGYICQMKKTIITLVSLIYSFNLSCQTIKSDTSYLSIDSINHHWLYSEIKDQGILYPDIVFAQGVLESGHFKSDLFRDNNNLFGMRQPKLRKTTATGKRKGYAVYSNWVESVQDYKLWQDSLPNKYKKNRKTYLRYIESTYCECRYYTSQVNNIIKRYREHLK